MRGKGKTHLQTTPTLSNVPVAAESESAANVPPTLHAQQLAERVQAMQALAQQQQQALQALQAQVDDAPLLGLRTDAPWGLAAEGLVLGAAALLLGAGAGWALAVPKLWRSKSASRRRAPVAVAQDFSDSMMFLSDQDNGWAAPGTVVQLHKPEPMVAPRADASLAAPSDALPGEVPPAATAPKGVVEEKAGAERETLPSGRSIFGTPADPMAFDHHAAASEVERVRNYLSRRRAARAMGLAPHVEQVEPLPEKKDPVPPMGHLGAEDTVRLVRASEEPATRSMVRSVDLELDLEVDAPPPSAPPVQVPSVEIQAPSWDSLVAQAEPTTATPAIAPLGIAVEQGQPADVAQVAEPLLELDLNLGSSMLAALDVTEQVTAQPSAGMDVEALSAGLALVLDIAHVEEPAKTAVPVVDAELDNGPTQGRCVQLELAEEFLDLGLIAEARERVMEVLQAPQTAFHAQARELLARIPADAAPSTY